MRQIPPWTQAGLPGRPVVESPSGLEDVSPGRVIRKRNGKVLAFTNEQDSRYVADLSTEFLAQKISRVFFMRKNGERQKETALAWPKGIPPVKCALMAIETLTWLCLRKRGAAKRKKVAGLVASK